MSLENIRAAIESSTVPLLPGTAADVASLLEPELNGIDPSVLPRIVDATLAQKRFEHFRPPVQVGPAPGSAEFYAQNMARPTGAFSRNQPGKAVDLSSGLSSHPAAASDHRALWAGSVSVQPNPGASTAPTLAAHLGERLGVDAQAFGVVGGLPRYRHAGVPKKNRGR